MDDRQRDARGFRVFSPELNQLFGCTYVVQSAIIYRGEHCWIYQHAAKDESNGVCLDVVGARAVRDALDTFIAEAESGQLKRPAMGG